MKLFTREWGGGDRHAVLVHGVWSSSENWRAVAPVLADRGYHVTAVDLPGHGRSPRATRYTMELLADSVLESVPDEPELVMGHSLGGLVVSLAVERMRPQRAVYVDPGFSAPRFAWWQRAVIPLVGRHMLRATRAQVAENNPRWDAEDVDIEVADFRAFDRRFLPLLTRPGVIRAPEEMTVPSLLVLADESRLVDAELAGQLGRLGFQVRIVPGAGHTVNRDDVNGFLAALDGWL